MRKLLLLLVTLITFTNVSYASFPVVEKVSDNTIESMIDPILDIILYIVLFIGSVYWAIIKTKQKYGTWYRPWSTYSYIQKALIWLIIAFSFILFISLFIHPDSRII